MYSLKQEQIKQNEERIAVHSITLTNPLTLTITHPYAKKKDVIEYSILYENEWRISQKIVTIPLFSQRYNIMMERRQIKMGNLYSKWVLEEETVNKNTNSKTNQFQLVTYSVYEDSVNINIYHKEKNKQTVNELYFIYQYLKESIQILNRNNIIYFNYESPLILKNPNTNHPILSNFGKSFSIEEGVQKEVLFQIIDTIKDFTNYPIEVYVLYYLKNTQRETLSYSNLEEILKTREKKEESKLRRWINKSSEEIYKSCISTVKEWDLYGLKRMFQFISYDDDSF
jgi:hypothetical protein